MVVELWVVQFVDQVCINNRFVVNIYIFSHDNGCLFMYSLLCSSCIGEICANYVNFLPRHQDIVSGGWQGTAYTRGLNGGIIVITLLMMIIMTLLL